MDRDGTLNVQVMRDGNPIAPATVDEFHLFPGVHEACRKLHDAGFALVVATNQPDVGRGTQSLAVVEAMHAKLSGSRSAIHRACPTHPPTRVANPRRACCSMRPGTSDWTCRGRG